MTQLSIKEHFAITHDFFTENPLADDSLKRFVNQKEPLKKLLNSLEMRQNCGIIGDFGSGKSSFLRKIEAELTNQGKFAKYFQVTLPIDDFNRTRLVFLRSTLRNLLELIDENQDLKKNFDPELLITETHRFEFSITLEDYNKEIRKLGGEIAGSAKFNLLSMMMSPELKAAIKAETGSETSEKGSILMPVHNEYTLLQSIFMLAKKLENPVILLIDEFDKIGREDLSSAQWDRQLMQVLELSRELMNSEKLLFVFSLQKELYQKLQKARQGIGDISLLGLIQSYEKLNDFDLDFAFEIVEKSLQYAHYQKRRTTLYPDEIVKAVHRDTQGKVRLFVHDLIELIQQAYFDDKQQIDKEVFVKCLRKKWDDMPEAEFESHLQKFFEGIE
jgi:hypothetical protein